jgi:hypothetical protein
MLEYWNNGMAPFGQINALGEKKKIFRQALFPAAGIKKKTPEGHRFFLTSHLLIFLSSHLLTFSPGPVKHLQKLLFIYIHLRASFQAS